MQRSSATLSVVLTAIVLIAGPVVAGDENVWVSADGHHIRHLGHDLEIEGATEFDLADLRDGESRTFGLGEKQVTVTRTADEATIVRAADRENSALSVSCRIGVDNCRVVTFDDDPARVLVMVEKTRRCENGVGDCDIDITALEGLGDAHARVLVHRTTECEEGEDCTEFVDLEHRSHSHRALTHIATGAADGEEIVFVREQGPGRVLFVETGDHTTLRCPEGDTTMRVDREEADDVFLCPKHSTPLERSKPQPHLRRLVIEEPTVIREE